MASRNHLVKRIEGPLDFYGLAFNSTRPKVLNRPNLSFDGSGHDGIEQTVSQGLAAQYLSSPLSM